MHNMKGTLCNCVFGEGLKNNKKSTEHGVPHVLYDITLLFQSLLYSATADRI